MFGYGEMDDADLVVRNTCSPPDQHIKCFNTTKHRLIEATGYTMRAVYHIVAIIILVNTLIALMSNTLSRVQVRESFWELSIWEFITLNENYYIKLHKDYFDKNAVFKIMQRSKYCPSKSCPSISKFLIIRNFPGLFLCV